MRLAAPRIQYGAGSGLGSDATVWDCSGPGRTARLRSVLQALPAPGLAAVPLSDPSSLRDAWRARCAKPREWRSPVERSDDPPPADGGVIPLQRRVKGQSQAALCHQVSTHFSNGAKQRLTSSSVRQGRARSLPSYNHSRRCCRRLFQLPHIERAAVTAFWSAWGGLPAQTVPHTHRTRPGQLWLGEVRQVSANRLLHLIAFSGKAHGDPPASGFVKNKMPDSPTSSPASARPSLSPLHTPVRYLIRGDVIRYLIRGDVIGAASGAKLRKNVHLFSPSTQSGYA